VTPAQVEQLSSSPTYNREVGGALPLDRWISYAVKVLRDAGIETFESCQGGRGHAFNDPTVRFHGGPAEGFRAFAVAVQVGLPVYALRRFWGASAGELSGPYWEIVFHPRSQIVKIQRDAERAGLLRGPDPCRDP
jgi:hypothetical protein